MKNRYHLGLNLGHERSAVVVRDGKIEVAIEQERLDRNKFSLGYLLQSPGNANQMQIPLEAIRYCLDVCQIQMADLASITANMPGEDLAPDILRRSFPPELCDRIKQIPSHHLAHAYSAYSPSGFDEALIWVADASGSTQHHHTESYSLYLGQGTQITPLHQETVESHLSGLGTLGFLYEYITKEAGFVTQVSDRIKHAEAGKLMGLAPFGSPQPHWHDWIHTRPDSYSLEISPYDIFLEVEAIKKCYDSGEGKPYLREHIVDLAYKVQSELEKALIHILQLAVERTGVKKLCIAGGIGLNSVANYKLLQALQLDDIFIFPAAGDSGIAAGCALWAYHTIEGGHQRVPLHQANLGKNYSKDEIEQAIAQFSDEVRVQSLSHHEVLDRTAHALSQGSIVARYEGGAEFGPRALGQRSIIADPTFRQMKDIINARVKFREAFRPFAPVIPLEAMSEVFEQAIAAPFMLLVANIKSEFHDQIPAITHVDGTGRVQSVTAEHNPFFHQLCYRLVNKRSGPPVLLNTSFNVAGQPIVETPAEAIATFLKTDIDFLAIENYWIAKQQVPVLDYEEHLSKVGPSPTPKGLGKAVPAVTDMMRSLDRAMFWSDDQPCPWTPEEVKAIAAKVGQFKETSRLFPGHPYSGKLKTRLSETVLLLLNPQGPSSLVDLRRPDGTRHYDPAQTKLLLAAYQGESRDREGLRLDMRLSPREFQSQLAWAASELSHFALQAQTLPLDATPPDSPIGSMLDTTLAPFESSDFSCRQILAKFYQRLKSLSYCEGEICQRLQVESLQHLQPTYLHYYDRHLLGQDELADCIRLFQLRTALPLVRMVELFGEDVFTRLAQLGLFIPRQNLWASRVDLFDVAGLIIATDHRYMLLPEDQSLTESPVMYIGMDSMGLVHTAPQYASETLLDLCCGSGVQGLYGSRYARQVIGVDINPRAIRFSRFNAQLNGIDNIEFRQGNLYECVPDQKFNTILANPPFVPSPTREFKFRDGGSNGEEILAAIVQGSQQHLCPLGRLHIVTDLVNIEDYATKLEHWWPNEATDQLVLGTADRNDILFSVPHSHAAFGQNYQDYCQELDRWLTNFHQANLSAVNFGYLFIHRNPTLSTTRYHQRTIHNPSRPIHESVSQHFQQRQRLTTPDSYQIKVHPDISLRSQWDKGQVRYELYSESNPYFTTYPVSDHVFLIVQEMMGMQPRWGDYVNWANQDLIQALVFKGILVLEPMRDRLPVTVNPLPINLNWVQPQLQPSPNVSEMTIAELQTKTTPTCLSSYL